MVRDSGKWLVSYIPLGIGRPARAPEMFIRASRVVLAAGVLGSAEILLRSRSLGLDLSDRLGLGFSANGDALGFAFNGRPAVHGVGYGSQQPEDRRVGPTITMMMTPTEPGAPLVEDAVVPSALGRSFAAALGLLSVKQDDRQVPRWLAWPLALGSAIGGPYHDGPDHTLSMLAMGCDAGTGILSLVNDRLNLAWVGASTERVFRADKTGFKQLADGLGAQYISDPFSTAFGGRTLITVHPLGGCAMGEDAFHGVVDIHGRVYRGPSSGQRGGRSLHQDLYILDGSILPGPVGVNPLLTIAALAERGAESMLGGG